MTVAVINFLMNLLCLPKLDCNAYNHACFLDYQPKGKNFRWSAKSPLKRIFREKFFAGQEI